MDGTLVATLRAELERRLDAAAAGPATWRGLEEPDTRDLRPAGHPLALLGAGAVLARPFVEHALAHLDVRLLVDNRAAGEVRHGRPVVDDDAFRAAARTTPGLLAVVCASAEAGFDHFAGLAAGCGVPRLTLYQALRRSGASAWARAMGEPAVIARLLDAPGLLDGFADDPSRATFLAVLLHRLTGAARWLEAVRRPERDAYFFTDALEPGPDEVLVDGGAFTGDTVQAFRRRTGGRYRHIHAFEPDPARLPALRAAVRGLADVTVHAAGLGAATGSLPAGAGGAGHVALAGDGPEVMPVVALDDLDLGPVSLVKLDIEGAELAALDGARRTLARDKPRLAVCVYHRPLDLLEIPARLRAIRPDYALRLRHHGPTLYETVLYAV